MSHLLHRLRIAGVAGVCLLAGGCEIDPVGIEEGDDRLIVEAVLRAGEPVQTVLLHRTIRGAAPRREPGAQVTVTAEGREIVFEEVDAAACALDATLRAHSSCYRSPESAGAWVVPGGVYELHLRTQRGERATGRTTVPGAFTVQGLDHAPARCSVEPGRTHLLTWTRSRGATAYLLELKVRGLSAALRDEGITAPDSVVLTSIRATAADTTAELPRNFIADDDHLPLLRRLKTGLPAGSRGSLVVAAIDHNLAKSAGANSLVYTGAGYRPSSVTGDASGLFGSLVPIPLALEVGGTGMACTGR